MITILLMGCNQKQKVDNNGKVDTSENKITKIEEDFSIDVKSARLFRFKNPNTPIEDTLVLSVEQTDFQITPLGLMIINDINSIQLKTDMMVEKAYLYEDERNYYVFFTETDMDVATSYLQKVSKEPLKLIYTKLIHGFNLGLPLICQDFAYVNTLGCVGKIDLNTGEYIWQHMDLYDNEKYSFNSFDTVLIKQKTTEFISENYKSKNIDKVIIDNETGEIITIDK